MSSSFAQTCPQCQLALVETGHHSIPLLCEKCGYVPKSPTASVDGRLERSNFRFIIGFSLVLVIGFIQLATWGKHAPEIRWLQAMDLIGLSSIQGLDKMAQICLELKRRDCVEHAYRRQSQLDPRQSVRLAEYQISRHKFNEAVSTLKPYVAKSKQDLRAYMTYANALTEVGQFDEAIRYYEHLIARSKGLPTEATQNYVKCLARAKRYEQAENLILKMRRRHPGTPRFMDGELRVLAGLKSVPEKTAAQVH